METPDEIIENIAALQRWFKEHGGYLNPKVRIQYDPRYGYYGQAVDDLKSESIVLECPVDLSLSHLNLDPSQKLVPYVQSDLRQCFGKLPGEQLTRLLLIEQLVLGEDSRWESYVACLPDPSDMTTALWFDSPYFANTSLEQARKDRLKQVEKEWKDARAVLREVGLGEGTPLYTECDLENYKWAYTILTSRSFGTGMILPDQPSLPILYPVLDILNHRPGSRVEWSLSRHISVLPQRTHGETDTKTFFKLKLLEDIKSGGEVSNNYGPKSNAELLLGYGFVIENNPVEQVILKARNLTEAPTSAHVKQTPFGMDPATIEYSAAGLRKKDNPLGRYANDVPFFQGIPSFVVQFAYELGLSRRNKFFDDKFTPTVQNPLLQGGRTVLATLLSLYEAILGQCARLTEMDFPDVKDANGTYYGVKPNQNHRNAWIYRKGQVDICNCIRKELRHVLLRLGMPNIGMSGLPEGPCIVTTSEALQVLQNESPEAFHAFTMAMKKYLNKDIENPAVSASSNAEKRIWVFLLIAFSRVRSSKGQEEGLIGKWMRDLETQYPVTMPKSAHQEGQFSAIRGRGVGDFQRSLQELKKIAKLNYGYRGAIFAADTSVIHWAIQVVNFETFVRPDKDDKTLKRLCMYMCPWGMEEQWVNWASDYSYIEPERALDMGPLDY